MLYKVADGSSKDEHYGLILARVVQLPQTILDRATEVSIGLIKRRDIAKKNSEAYQVSRRRNLVMKLFETLILARDGLLDDEALKSWLLRVQEDFVERMAQLSDGTNEEDSNCSADSDIGEDEMVIDGESDEDEDEGIKDVE
jgi:DNA mismatch repair protein MSH4